MALTMVEIPGRRAGNINGVEVKGLGAQCPYCSKVHDEYNYEAGKPLAFPTNCERCGSPMEPGPEATRFNNERAAKEQRIWDKPDADNVFSDVDFAKLAADYLRSQGYSVKATKHVASDPGQDGA